MRFQGIVFLLTASLFFCLPATSESQAGKKFVAGEDHLKNKARWEWKLLDGKKVVDKGTFMGMWTAECATGKTKCRLACGNPWPQEWFP